MSYLYVSEQGASIGIEANRFQVNYKDGMIKSIPAETLEMIEVFGSVQITTRCLTECLKRGVNILFYSTSGAYYGRLISTSHVNVQRQRIQAEIGHNETFKLEMSKRIIDAKIRNQVVVLRRYARGRDEDIHRMIIEMQNMQKKLPYAKSVEQVMGYEGTAAKIYFKVLGKLIDEQFVFEGRSRRPPMDPFNSLISLGYSIILNELYGKIEGKGLNPYFGFMHRDAEKHPTLASDLMEEWRAVIVDATVMSIINGNEITKEEFTHNVDEPGCYLNRKGVGILIKKLEKKFQTDVKYLSYIDYTVDFRHAMLLQVNQLVKAMESEDASLYYPIQIR